MTESALDPLPLPVRAHARDTILDWKEPPSITSICYKFLSEYGLEMYM